MPEIPDKVRLKQKYLKLSINMYIEFDFSDLFLFQARLIALYHDTKQYTEALALGQ